MGVERVFRTETFTEMQLGFICCGGGVKRSWIYVRLSDGAVEGMTVEGVREKKFGEFSDMWARSVVRGRAVGGKRD